MERLAQSPVPAIAAAHIAALTTVSAAPVFRRAGLLFRWRGDRRPADFVDLAWRPSPSVVLRGWQPRSPEQRTPSWRAVASETLAALFDHLAEWHDRAKSRRALLAMDDRALHDIGIERATADYEGNLPFWRLRP